MNIYKGEQDCCAMCRRRFSDKEVVMHEGRLDLLFCQAPVGAVLNCSSRWVLAYGRSLALLPAFFRAKAEAIPGYGGGMTRCTGCGKPFWHLEIVFVDLAWPVAFCTHRVEDCVDRWRDRIGQPSAVHQAKKYRFHGNT